MVKVNWYPNDNNLRLGNRLFQYVFARLLAEDRGLQLVSDMYPNPILENIPPQKGRIVNDVVKINDSDKKGSFWPDSKEQRGFIVEGYFQRGEYYRNKRPQLKSFFKLSPICYNDNKINIVAHIRLGDYKRFGKGGVVISPQWYIDILEKENFEKLFIVTNEPEDREYLKHFDRYNPIIYNDSAQNDFYFMMGFKKMIMSNSTFAWWAACLGRAEKVYSFKPWIKHCVHVADLWDMEYMKPVDGEFAYYE